MSHTVRAPLTYALAGMIAMAVAMGIGRFVYTPILPGMMEGLGISASDAGLIASSNYIGYLLGAVLAGGNWGQGREFLAVMGALLATAVLSALMAFSDNLFFFLVVRFLAGIASAFVLVFMATIVFGRLALAGRSELHAVHFGGVGFGIAVSSLLIGILTLLESSWQAGWLWSGALAAIGFLVVLTMIDKGPPQTTRPVAEGPLPRTPAMVRLILAYGLFGFGYIVTATFLVAIVRQGEAGPWFEAVVWLATGLAGIPSIWLWNKVAGRFGRTTAFAAACLVEAFGVLASVTLGSYAGPLIGGVLLGGTFIAVTAIGLQIARDIAIEAPRRAVSLMTAAFGVGQIIGPIVAGLIADRTGTFTAPSILAAIALVACALIAGRRG